MKKLIAVFLAFLLGDPGAFAQCAAHVYPVGPTQTLTTINAAYFAIRTACGTVPFGGTQEIAIDSLGLTPTTYNESLSLPTVIHSNGPTAQLYLHPSAGSLTTPIVNAGGVSGGGNFSGMDFVTVQGLELTHSGVGLNPGGSMVVDSCKMHNFTSAAISANIAGFTLTVKNTAFTADTNNPHRYISVDAGTADIGPSNTFDGAGGVIPSSGTSTIHNNTFSHTNGFAGIFCSGPGTGIGTGAHCIGFANYLHDDAINYALSCDTGGVCDYYNNIIENYSTGLNCDNVATLNAYNNTIYKGINFGVQYALNCVVDIKNNAITVGSGGFAYDNTSGSPTGSAAIDYNGYDITASGATMQRSGVSTFSAWQGLGFDAHGKSGTITYLNPGATVPTGYKWVSGNLLQFGGKVLSPGACFGAVDFFGDPCPGWGPNPDIGAWQHGPIRHTVR